MQAGRDPSALEVGVRFPPFGKPFEEQLETDLEPMLAAGVTPRSVAEAAPVLEKMARAFEAYR